ncbi:GATA transcription factor 5 [Actinidia rufa]|uniref:GATA transcription factor 5 n=1 Tax=Actinidia rufa TaxID=165716 RepID=A0A7J0DTX1_9ERIC|nr:GATA transcription factor 5 [Actinidia rufa]
MEAVLDPGARFRVEDLLNFSLDVGEEDDDDDDDDDDEKDQKTPSSYSLESSNPHSHDPDDHQSLSLPRCQVGLTGMARHGHDTKKFGTGTILARYKLGTARHGTGLSGHGSLQRKNLNGWQTKTHSRRSRRAWTFSGNPGLVLNHHSPVSVLENTTTSSSSNSTTMTSCCGDRILAPVHYPVKARSTRQRRRRCSFSDLPSQQWWGWAKENINNSKKEFRAAGPPSAAAKIGWRCWHCLDKKTPQWHAGPMGPKTLCNACGVRYKSGRLVPEYCPASSPTFSSLLHSNSHRKVIEMRRQKQMGEMVLNEACGYIVG